MEWLRLKFESGNDVPVTEARITRKEFDAIEDEIAELKEGIRAAIKTPITDKQDEAYLISQLSKLLEKNDV